MVNGMTGMKEIIDNIECVEHYLRSEGDSWYADLLCDSIDLLKSIRDSRAKTAAQDIPGEPFLPGTRFRTTTGDLFAVTRVEGPCCTVTQVRTGFSYIYGVDALLRLPITWEGGEKEDE